MDDFEKVNVPSKTEPPSLFNLSEVISAVTYQVSHQLHPNLLHRDPKDGKQIVKIGM